MPLTPLEMNKLLQSGHVFELPGYEYIYSNIWLIPVSTVKIHKRAKVISIW